MIAPGALLLYMLFAFAVGFVVGVVATASASAFAVAWQEFRWIRETRRKEKDAWKAINKLNRLIENRLFEQKAADEGARVVRARTV